MDAAVCLRQQGLAALLVSTAVPESDVGARRLIARWPGCRLVVDDSGQVGILEPGSVQIGCQHVDIVQRCRTSKVGPDQRRAREVSASEPRPKVTFPRSKVTGVNWTPNGQRSAPRSCSSQSASWTTSVFLGLTTADWLPFLCLPALPHLMLANGTPARCSKSGAVPHGWSRRAI